MSISYHLHFLMCSHYFIYIIILAFRLLLTAIGSLSNMRSYSQASSKLLKSTLNLTVQVRLFSFNYEFLTDMFLDLAQRKQSNYQFHVTGSKTCNRGKSKKSLVFSYQWMDECFDLINP